MDKTDAKVRLFLELSHPHPIQILSYIPIYSYEKWNPEEMYKKPNSQYYYAFINDNELISKVKSLFNPDVNVLEEIEYIKEDSEMTIEFNGYNIEEFQEIDELIKANINPGTPYIINNNDKDKNENNNLEDEKYVVFCRFHLKNFGFIHDYNKLFKEDLIKIENTPIVYALKGRIKALIEYRKKELESKKESEMNNLSTHISIKDEDNPNNINNIQNLGQKKEDDKNKLLKGDIGIDGHWFLVNNFYNIELLSLIKYKEIMLLPSEILQNKINTNSNTLSIPSFPQNTKSYGNSISRNNLSNLINPSLADKFLQPSQYSYYIKDSKKFVTVYQNKSCRYHHNKNDFICKTCRVFCCLECFETDSKYNSHHGHKIALLDEAINKFEEDSKFLDERIQYLKTIIENEITEKKNEIQLIKNKNHQIINQINNENEKIRLEIKKEEINRAKVLAFLGNEALRIINDYNLKIRYLKLLNEKSDMNTYLKNYFFFVKFYKTEIRKNLVVLERKIILTAQKFNINNEKLNRAIEDLKKTL